MTPLRTVIITGVSGGGKSTALRALEDLGYYCIDNLPLPLLSNMIELMEETPSVDRLALVVDARLRPYIAGYAAAAEALARQGQKLEVVYLDAHDDVLLRRFSQTRRRHPIEAVDLRAALTEERRVLVPLRDQATLSLATSEISPHELRQTLQDYFGQARDQLLVTLFSFGFRYGLPSHADLVFDVRFLKNPYFVEDLRRLTGMEPAVRDYVMSDPGATTFLEHVEGLLAFLLPRYRAEGKVYLTVAIGCTGGQHRSVALAEALTRRLSHTQTVNVRHRDASRASMGS